MSIRVALHHKTTYEYDRPVSLSPQVIRLRPAPHCRTSILSYSLRVLPEEQFINWQQDPQGNFLARLVFPEPTTVFSVEVDLVADLTVINPFDFFLEPQADKFPFTYDDRLRHELSPFLETEPAGPKLQAWIDSVSREPKQSVTFLVELNQRLQSEIRYLIRMEPGVQTPEDTLTLLSGSCRDTSWLLVHILRHLGLAARFVSGYLIQLTPDQKPLDGPPGPTADFTDLHAWVEAYLPGAGWVGLDPTSGLFAGEGHIPLAATPHPETAAPITGMVSPSKVEFEHDMSVTRIHEDPRVTKPYSDAEWERVNALGAEVDRVLSTAGVGLTMGGEPTFISIDDMDGEEWNTAAMGPDKARMAGKLLSNMRDHFAPGALLHFGQGKWYPGESLPRWAYSCIWRSDSASLWQDPKWIGEPTRDYGYKEGEAKRFIEALAGQLGVSTAFIHTAYEDPLAWIAKEQRLPVDVDPIDNRLEDPEERERMRRVYSRGLSTPVAFVLPLRAEDGKDGPVWQTGLWMLRGARLFLIPGDSPAGFRLPLASLPTSAGVNPVWPVDPMDRLSPLPMPGMRRRQQQLPAEARDPDEAVLTAAPVVPTALAVEARNGRLHVFIPPTRSADDYADLVDAIERSAAQLEMPVLMEGYVPPFDPRLNQIKVTPDPGVIEVNIHPARDWKELVDHTTALYECARNARLATDKFMLDGRHTGTGGGNHIVLGGATPSESPFLRRPDLLASFVGYWLNHPSLSYLFSGVFIGPTSQAPRVDETRADAVYELEIAFEQLRNSPQPPPHWLVDRIFRNLLVDVTGNTHRSEFCIDKLFSPDSASGRLGLVEMRAFEMPPHARMSLIQQLLVRTLVAWFWHNPYKAKPIRWGTRLHDRFLLPYYVKQDFDSVIRDLREAGYALESDWFAAHFEFRFPVYGTVCYDGISLELRQAIEPWYVLGEEPGGGGTTRFVDSSVERLQVHVTGFVGEQKTIVCNGRRLPLQSTGTHGEYVCGVRYRAWQPPRCLHPTIGVHTPLVFDLLDLGNERSLGGCTYLVAHPGGRNFDTFPVNSNEAEARRKARFLPYGHTPGKMPIPAVEVDPEYPSTLDLRRSPFRNY